MLWTGVLEKTLESLLDCKEIQPVNPKGNQSWIFTGRTDAEAEAPILWPPDGKNWLTDAGKDWRREEKGTTEDEMVGWHQWLDGHEFEQAPWVGDGQGNLACCSPKSWTRLSDWTEFSRQITLSYLNIHFSEYERSHFLHRASRITPRRTQVPVLTMGMAARTSLCDGSFPSKLLFCVFLGGRGYTL